MSKNVKTGIWSGIAILALAYLVLTTPRATFKDTIIHINWSWGIWAILFQMTAQSILAGRWVLLLKVQEVHISLFQAVKLTYLGLFYNNMMPGSVGGDLLKGWYITQHCDKSRRVEAAVTVFVDRLVGLIGTILLSVVASFFIGPDIAYGRLQIRYLVWSIFLAMIVGSVIFLSKRIRMALRLNILLEKLPFAGVLKKADSAIQIYRHHKQIMIIALLMTALLQSISICGIWMLTQALHLDIVKFIQCLIIMPIIWVIGAAIPVPGGIGIIENSVRYLFRVVINPVFPNDADAVGQAAALALLIRVLICVCSLPGALVPIFGGHLPKMKEMEKDLKNIDN
ncbi:MAG: flippase-like domain-containing protein [Sedimentisphaerales bacterium]|nr:flippase-like domain-containing protein [Sedimentisphaerales bacterium]